MLFFMVKDDDFEIPIGVYIGFNSGPAAGSRDYKLGSKGDCYVSVYRGLDRGHGNPPVQHVVHLGNFVVKDNDDKNAREFFDEIRSGLEKVLKEN